LNKLAISHRVPSKYDAATFAEFLRQIERFTNGFLIGETTYDPPNLVDGTGTTTTVTVAGAVLGDFAIASFSNDLQGITLTAFVSAAHTASVRFQNESGGALDLASGTLRALVLRRQ
jgi:uncharacterized membrane protein